MAREQRKDVDYFPHDCTHGRKMNIIESKYGNDGYATWFKLLEQLGKANNHYIDISDEMTLMFLTSTFKISEEMTLNILSDLAKLNAIDKFLYEEHRIIWSEKFVNSIEDAYRKRKNKIFQYSDVLNEKGIKNVQSGGGLTLKEPNTAEVIPKEKKRKEEESKVEESKEDEFDNTKNLQHLNSLKNESPSWIETIAMQQKTSIEIIPKKLDEFELYLRTIFKSHETKKEFITHFVNWLPKNLNNGTRHNTRTASGSFETNR